MTHYDTMMMFVLAGVAVLIGPVAYRVGCCLNNRIVGDPGRPGHVPEPSYYKATTVLLTAALVGMFFAYSNPLAREKVLLGTREIPVWLIVGIVANFLCMLFQTKYYLPTSYGRAFIVLLLYALTAVVLCLVLAAVTATALYAMGVFD